MECFERIYGCTSPERRLDPGHPDPRIAGHSRSGREALREGRHSRSWLERILRANEPPNFLHIQAFDRFMRDVHMALMRRIEGAAEQTDPHPASGQAPSKPVGKLGGGQLTKTATCHVKSTEKGV